MACMCVLLPGHECDGCQECNQGYDEIFDDYDELLATIKDAMKSVRYKGEAMI